MIYLLKIIKDIFYRLRPHEFDDADAALQLLTDAEPRCCANCGHICTRGYCQKNYIDVPIKDLDRVVCRNWVKQWSRNAY